MTAYGRKAGDNDGHQQEQPAVQQFLEFRWQLAQATSPAFADGLIAIIIAGLITQVLVFVFA